jgi:hypothetical protein
MSADRELGVEIRAWLTRDREDLLAAEHDQTAAPPSLATVSSTHSTRARSAPASLLMAYSPVQRHPR